MQPFYHLRPNKSIDRSLFIQTLQGLDRIFPINDYVYTGFGSFLFDDFKLLHDTLGIRNMVSLEMDPRVYKRAQYNCPYSCIKIENTDSTHYISELLLDDEEHDIFWLDFVSPGELGQQLGDYAALLDKLKPYDIVRITLNANPDSLGKNSNAEKLQEQRLAKFRELVSAEYIPTKVSTDDVTRKRYPLLLLKVLKAISCATLRDRPPIDKGFLFPLFSAIYADGQQMLTFTGIVLDSHDEEQKIKEALSLYGYINFSWDEPTIIDIPALSDLEIFEMNKLLPAEDARQQLTSRFDFVFSEKEKDVVDSYVAFYRYFPHYHKISF